MEKSPHFHKTTSSPSSLPSQLVITHEGELHGEDTLENREMVRRIHACVNACDGISTEELEQGIVQDMQRVIAEVAPVLYDKNRQAPPQRPLAISIPGVAGAKSANIIENR
jgi:hypothetical protein